MQDLNFFSSVNCPEGQFLVAQRIGERHTSKDVKSFLEDFHNSKAPFPKELICDQSRALLNAAVLAYSRFRSLEEYADAMRDSHEILVRIRIDIAHFRKKYATSLKSLRTKIKTFFMASIGILAITTDIKEAEKIIRSIFIVSRSETVGILRNKRKTESQKCLEYLEQLITSEY